MCSTVDPVATLMWVLQECKLQLWVEGSSLVHRQEGFNYSPQLYSIGLVSFLTLESPQNLSKSYDPVVFQAKFDVRWSGIRMPLGQNVSA